MDIAFDLGKRPPTEFKLQAAREQLALERELTQHQSACLEEGMQGLLILAGVGVVALGMLSIALAAGYGVEGGLMWPAIILSTPMVWWVFASCRHDALAGQLKRIECVLECLAPVDEDDSRTQVLQQGFARNAQAARYLQQVQREGRPLVQSELHLLLGDPS